MHTHINANKEYDPSEIFFQYSNIHPLHINITYIYIYIYIYTYIYIYITHAYAHKCRQAGMIGFITLQQSAPSDDMTSMQTKSMIRQTSSFSTLIYTHFT